MQSIRGERRTGVRRTRRKVTLAVIVLGILGVSYLWQVSRQKSEALNPKKFSSEAGNLRFILEEGHKSKSNHGELLHSTVAMATNQSNIKEEVHLKEVVPLKSRNESKTLSSSSPIASPVKLFSQEKISPNSTVSRGIHIKNGAGWREDLKRNITNVSGLNRDGPSVRMPSRSKEEVENGKNKQVGEGREVESLRTEEVKKTQLAPYVQNENHTTIRESFQNKSRDTALLNLMHNNESVTSFMMTGGYNYTEPRYSFSPAGQFQLQTFVKELANFSKNPTFENSLFNVSDKIRLILLSKGEIREIYSITHHPKLKLVAFDTPMSLSCIVPIESCPVCGTVKSPDDINEVFAFHVDRVLRINRALPVSARLFQDIELENLNLEGDEDRDQPRPVMWFAKDLTHGGKFQTDQNSFQLNWRTYQEILSGCHEKANLTRAINCTEINYSEWSRMAVLDFVMQNHDRLDRYCCGYNEIDEGEACFRNEVMYEIEGCDDIENRYLVHILTTKSNPHQLILLDNSGNLYRSKEHLNFEILKGIRTIPKEVMEMIYSENLQDRLLESLKWDSVYWKSMGEENIKQQAQIISERPLSTYNSLQDKNLVGYFNNNRMRRHLRKSGLINKRGEIVTESTYRLTMARKEHQRHVRDLMAQAIVHKALDMERHRQASIKKKLEEIAKVELVRRVRSERARKGDEDITPFLSPRAPSGRPHSANSHRRRTRGNPHRRPSTAPTNKSASYDKQHAVYVDEDGFPVHRERSYQDDSEEIDSHNLRELDPKVMNNISLHLRPEDREGLAPYRVNQALKPHPPPSQAKSQRIRQRPAKSKTVITKDGRKLKPKSHKGSLALHRKEPAYPHANQLQTMCDVTVRYRGNNLKIQYEREDLRDEITIYQQHCGGENLLVFEGMAEPGTDLVFTSRRHRGYPFSVTFFVNRVQSLRLSACCEYKYTPHSLLGGAKGHFKFIRVDGAAPCYRCMVEAELARRERQRYRGTQTEQRDPSPEPEPEKTVIATQTEETGEEEENKDGYEDDFEEEEKAEAETKEDSDSSEGETGKRTKDQDTEASDHFFSDSEKAGKKEKDEYSDSDFEKDSDKEEEKSDKEEEGKLDERKDDRNEDSIAEENADEEKRPVEQTETEDEIASIKSEVVGKEKDGESRREDERQSERDKDEEESIRSDVERENDMQEVEAESVKSDDESEKEKKDEVSNLEEEDKKELEEKGKTETTQKEDDEKIDSESESEMKYKNESSDEEEVTSVRSKSRASLSNSENDYRPLSPTSSSSSESENEMEKKESELLSSREDKKVIHDATEEKGRVEDDEEVLLDDKKTTEVTDKIDDDGQSTEDLKGTVPSREVPEELSQTLEKTGDPQVGEIDKEGTGVQDAIIVASAEDGEQSVPPVVIINGRDSQTDETERVEDEGDGLQSSVTDEPVVSERSVEPPLEADVESDKRDEDAMEDSKEDGSDVKRQEDGAESDEDAVEEKEEIESHGGDSRDVGGDESSKEDAGEVGDGKLDGESADMAKDENGGEYEMKISGDGDHSERSQKNDGIESRIDKDEVEKSFLAEMKQEADERVREDVSDKEDAIDSGVGENKVMEDEEQEADKSENAGGDEESEEPPTVIEAEKEEEVASSGQKDKDIDEDGDKVEDSHKDKDSDKDEGNYKDEESHRDEDSQNVDHNDKDDNQNDSKDGEKTEQKGTNETNDEGESGSQMVVEEEKAPSDHKEDEKMSADEGKKPETGSSSDEDSGSSGSEEDVTRPAVTVLNLNEKGISPERAVKLASSLLKPRYSQVQYLLLRSNPIGDKGLVAIVQSLTEIHKRNSSNDEGSGLCLTHLDIGDTQITNKGINELSEFLKLPTKLKNLNLSDNKMSKLGWLALAAGVRDNTALNTVSVEYMELGDEGAREICDAVADSKTIKELNLEGNQIGDEGGEAILKMLRDNERIEVVNFERDNNIPSHISQEIKDML